MERSEYQSVSSAKLYFIIALLAMFTTSILVNCSVVRDSTSVSQSGVGAANGSVTASVSAVGSGVAPQSASGYGSSYSYTGEGGSIWQWDGQQGAGASGYSQGGGYLWAQGEGENVVAGGSVQNENLGLNAGQITQEGSGGGPPEKRKRVKRDNGVQTQSGSGTSSATAVISANAISTPEGQSSLSLGAGTYAGQYEWTSDWPGYQSASGGNGASSYGHFDVQGDTVAQGNMQLNQQVVEAIGDSEISVEN